MCIIKIMKEEIKQRVIELFKPALETIERQSNCDHQFKINYEKRSIY
jgi:hypothetical protein